MRVKNIIAKYKGMTGDELSKALSSVNLSLTRELMGKNDDPSAHGRIRILRYEKAVVMTALSKVKLV